MRHYTMTISSKSRAARTATLAIMAIMAILAMTLMACDTTESSDYYGPRVISTSPVNGARNMPVGTTVSVLFNEAISYDTMNTKNFTLSLVTNTVTGVAGTISYGGISATFVPSSPLAPNSTYLVTLTQGITDVYHNPMTIAYIWHFSTGAGEDMLTTFSPAGTVIGQMDLAGALANMGGPYMANTLSGPMGAFEHEGMLYIADTLANRVLGFDTVPISNGASADFVLGQADFDLAGAGSTASALNAPSAVQLYGGMTFAADAGNNRVLIWNTVAVTNAASAYIALGQPDLVSNSAGCSAYMLNSPSGLSVEAGRVVVADTGNNRVLVWNSIPAVSNTPADVVLGHSLMNSCAAGSPVAADTLDSPTGLWSDGARLAVADTGNNRVLVWNNFPLISNAPAGLVLGQPDMLGSNPYVSALDMNAPMGIDVSTDNKLYVADSGNSRVMIWERFPLWSYERADAVLGQAAFYLGACNDSDGDGSGDVASGRTLCGPAGVHAIGSGMLVVTDTGNNRTLIYNAP